MSLMDLRDALVASKCGQPDQVTTLIVACLEEGISSGVDIVKTIADMGYKRQFVGLQLSVNAGPNPDRYRWHRTSEGNYRLH